MMALGLLTVIGLIVLGHVLGLAAGYLVGWKAGFASATAATEVQFPPPIAVNWPLHRKLDDAPPVTQSPTERNQS